MISAIVLVSDTRRRGGLADSERLVRSLVWLVSAVVAGVVSDVTVAGPVDLGLSDIADQSGCAVIEADVEAVRLTRAVAVSKHPRLLVIESGFQPGDGMIAELDRLARMMDAAAAARVLATPVSVWQRLFPDRAPTVGLIAATVRCRSLAGRDFAGLIAGVKPARILATRASPIF